MKNLRRRKNRTETKRQAGQMASRGSRWGLQRWLRAEMLEQRQLLAGDGAPLAHHNDWAPTDVNSDFRITPIDALVVLNELNRNGARELAGEAVEPAKFVDVNGDNRLSPLDALQVINSLNRGSGENVAFIELQLGLTDDAGNSLLDPQTRTADLSVGDIVNLEVLYTDARNFGAGLGLFTVYTDILTTQTGVLEPLVTETQVLSFSENLVDGTGGSALLTQAGSSVLSTIPFSEIASSPEDAIRNALINDFGYAPEQVLTTLETREPRSADRPEGDPFDIYVRFLGDEFIDADVPNFNLDASGITTSTGQPVAGSSAEIPAELPDGSINPEAVGFSLDPRSRTTPSGEQAVYTNVRSGSFNDDPNDAIPDGFGNIGATGQLNAGGLPAIVSGYNPDVPFEAYSMRVRVTETIQNLVLNIDVPLEDPNNPNETVLVIYGNYPDGTSGDEFGLRPSDITLDGDSILRINVTAAVTANPDSITTDEDNSGSVNVLANDTNQGTAPLSLVSVTDGANGTVTFTGGVVTYTPDPDFFGTDQFTYVAENGDGDRGTGTVTVTVASVNDPPTADDFSISVTEGQDRVLDNSEFISRSDAGPANENQTPVLVSVSDANSLGTAVLNGDGSVTYTAPVAYEGPDSFTYTISDGEDTVTATVSVTVLDQNDPPVANDDVYDGVEDTPVTFTEQEFYDLVLANDTPGPQNEIDNGQTVTLQSIDATGSAGGTWVDNGDGTFNYTPPANVYGSPAETFSYTITDGELTDTGKITINLAPVNDPPVANDDNEVVDELTTDNVLNVLDNDSAGPFEDGDQTISIVEIVDQPANGTATISADGMSILYTPNDAFIGNDTLTYVITDGELQSSTGTVSIEVVPVIRPRARDDQFSVAEDSGTTSLDVLANDLANEGETVTLETVDTNIPASQGTLVINGSQIDFTPAANFFGEVTFSYTISDTSNPVIDDADEIAAATGEVTIMVTPVNDGPVFVPDAVVSGVEDTPLSVDGAILLANDGTGADNEDDTLSITAVAATSAQNGTVTLDGSTILYTPAADYNSNIVPVDTVTYTISDGAGGTTTGTLTIALDPVNDPPELDLNDLTADEDVETVFSQADVLGNSTPGPATAFDEVNQTLEVTSVGSNGMTAQGGTVTLQNGSIVYTSAENFFGTDSFMVTVTDSEGASRTGTVTVTVDNVNDPPELGDPNLLAFSQSIAEFSSADLLEGANVGPGEADVPGQVLSVVGATGVQGTRGTVVFNPATGSVTYTPEEGYVGDDQFRITISDGVDTTSGLVTVTVREFEPSTISGEVFFDFLESPDNPVRDGIQDPHEPGLQMAQVRLVSGANENVTGQAINHTLMTDQSGDFAFTNVPPGTYRVIFDMPLLVWDGPDIAGSRGDSDDVLNQFTLSIEEPGGVTADGYNFTVLGYSGRAGNALDLLVSSYMAANPDVALDSENGLLGAKSYVGADGRGVWFAAKGGFDDVAFGEINVDEGGEIASLSVIMQDGTVRTGIIPASHRVILEDPVNGGYVVQIFGSVDSFDLQPDGVLDDSEFGLMMYQHAVDAMLAQDPSVI